jgi:hypothetical protein
MLFNDQSIATGTGIVAGHPSGRRFLITALHNLSGREPITNIPKDKKNSALPNRVRVEAYFTDFYLSLYDGANDPNTDHPLFKTHQSGSAIDVTVLPVSVHVDAAALVDQSFLNDQLIHSCH